MSSWIRSELRWLWKWISPFVHWHVASFLCISAASFLALLAPLVLRWMIDQIIPRQRVSLLYLATGLIFVGFLARTLLTSLGNYLILSAAGSAGLRLRLSLLRHLDRLSADYYESTPVGAVLYPFKEPIEEVSYFGSDLLASIVRTFLTTCFTFSAMLMLSPALTLAILPLVPVFLIARQHFRKKLTADSDNVQCSQLASMRFLEEHLSSAIAIQLLGREHRQERKAFQLFARTVSSQQKLFRTGVGFAVCTSLAIILAMAAVIGYGGHSVIAGRLSTGSLVAFYSFVIQLFDPLNGAADLYTRAQKAFACARQVQTVFDLTPSVGDSPAAVVLPQEHPLQIEVDAVEFGYERQKNMLVIPFLRILSGEQVAIAGENGAGKSTLAKLIARFYDVDSGGDPDRRTGCAKHSAGELATRDLLHSARPNPVRWNLGI